MSKKSSRFVSKQTTDTAENLKFTLEHLNVSFANAVRRTILADISTVVFVNIEIETNTSRFNNELVKHRLIQIPIHITTLETEYLNGFTTTIDVENTSQSISYVTTSDCQIEPPTLNRDDVFPIDELSNQYIDILRLNPGERITLTAKFGVSSASNNSSFNVVSKCTFVNTDDMEKIETIRKSTKWTTEMEEKNFLALNAHRHFKLNSFDFTIKSIGVFSNTRIVNMALLNLIQRLKDLRFEISEKDKSFEICLFSECYTIGKMLEYCFHNSFFENSKQLYFCGFVKMHPHDVNSFIKLTYKNNKTTLDVTGDLQKCINECIEVIEEILKAFQ